MKRLGPIEAAIAGLDPATAPGFALNGLKREELIAWNSMILHELYFANLGAPSQPGGKLAAALERVSAASTAGPLSSPPWARRWAADRDGWC